AGHALRDRVQPAREGHERAQARWQAVARGSGGARADGTNLRRPRGAAVRGAARALGTAERRLAGSRFVDHQTFLYGVREALLRAGPRDPRAVRPADGCARGVRGGRYLVRRAGHVRNRVPVVAGGHHLLWLVRDPEEHHRRARARPAEGSARRPPEGLTPWTSHSAPTSSS